jgi:hypothetical protein
MKRTNITKIRNMYRFFLEEFLRILKNLNYIGNSFQKARVYILFLHLICNNTF